MTQVARDSALRASSFQVHQQVSRSAPGSTRLERTLIGLGVADDEPRPDPRAPRDASIRWRWAAGEPRAGSGHPLAAGGFDSAEESHATVSSSVASWSAGELGWILDRLATTISRTVSPRIQARVGILREDDPHLPSAARSACGQLPAGGCPLPSNTTRPGNVGPIQALRRVRRPSVYSSRSRSPAGDRPIIPPRRRRERRTVDGAQIFCERAKKPRSDGECAPSLSRWRRACVPSRLAGGRRDDARYRCLPGSWIHRHHSDRSRRGCSARGWVKYRRGPERGGPAPPAATVASIASDSDSAGDHPRRSHGA